MDARGLAPKPAKDHVEYGARERLAYYNDRDRKLLRRINREPLLHRFFDWLLGRTR
jgi:hypothetical protein